MGLAVTLLAAAQGGAARPGEPAFFQFLPMIALAVMAYLLLIVPMRRERRQRMLMVAALKKGDRVVISNAIIGTVTQEPKTGEAGDAEVLVRIDEGNVKMRVLVSAITRVIPDKKDSKDGA